MSAKREGKAQVSGKQDDTIVHQLSEAVQHEMARSAGALESVPIIRSRDIDRIAEHGINATARLAILSQILLPSICDVIGRGLTLEELELFTCSSEKEVRAALRKYVIKDSTSIVREEASRDDWVNIEFIVKKDKYQERDENAPRHGDRLLVPARIGRKRSRHRTFSQVTGALPELYRFRGPWLADVELEERIERKLDANDVFLQDGLAVERSLWKLVGLMIVHPSAPEIAMRFASFLHDVSSNARRYAHRYLAVNEDGVFNEISGMAATLELIESSMYQLAELLKTEDGKRQTIQYLDTVISETKPASTR